MSLSFRELAPLIDIAEFRRSVPYGKELTLISLLNGLHFKYSEVRSDYGQRSYENVPARDEV